MLTVHDKPYKCSICDFTTKEKIKLLKHIEAHDNPYKCSDCDYKNVEQDNVFEHIKEKHKGKNPYKCGKCDFTASNGDSVLKHIDENHKENNMQSIKNDTFNKSCCLIPFFGGFLTFHFTCLFHYIILKHFLSFLRLQYLL